MIASWAPSLNAQGLAITASPDGSRGYVAGDFTAVNGAARNRVVALDGSTGAVIAGFAPNVSSRVRSLAATADTLYLFHERTGQRSLPLAPADFDQPAAAAERIWETLGL